MSTYTISQAAGRSGFSPSALRYYEGIGLVLPAGRTAAGYRLYDDRAVARLGFIARAKQLGCTLEEITDLIAVWDGDRCGPVQQRLHGLVTAKLDDARHQVAELTAFTGQLREAAAHLSGDPVDGPCGDGCACATAAPKPASVPARVALTARPDEPPVACSLGAAELSGRVDEWQGLLNHAQSRSTTPDGALRVEFDQDIDLKDLADLVTAEQRCCPFFAFTLTVDVRGVGLEIRAPRDAGGLVDEVFEPRP